MKNEYNFSKGERGKFYHSNAELNIPIYLEPDIADFMREISRKKGIDIDTLVNDLLRKDMGLILTVK